jgi:hypothetical protein
MEKYAMKLKNMVSAGVVVAALAAASGAHATWDSGANTDGSITNPAGNGEALLFLVDETTKNSYVQDLNVRFDTLYSGGASATPIALDSTGLSVFGGNYSNVHWGIVAFGGNNVDGGNLAATHYGAIQSTSSSIPTISDVDLFGAIANFGQILQGANSNVLFGNLAAGFLSATNGGAGYAGDDAFYAQLNAIGPMTGLNGNTLNLWLRGFATDDASVGLQNILGTATLNLSGGNGSLVLNQAPAVPVPAAAWMMGSALAGLAGIARRRRAA